MEKSHPLEPKGSKAPDGGSFGGGFGGGSSRKASEELSAKGGHHEGTKAPKGSQGRGDAHTHAKPVRSRSGRTFVYNGQRLAQFVAPPFVWPNGYHYRHYTVGWLLPAAFLNRTYYLDNFGDYGLASPPDGFGWFRYGPDLLLVDMGSGRISSVVPGVFDEAVVPEITSDADSPQ